MLVKSATEFCTTKTEDITPPREMVKSFSDYINDPEEQNHIISMSKFLKENHAEKVLRELKTDDLPEAEGLECQNSQVGAFIPDDEIIELYGDDCKEILDKLGKDGILVYYWSSENAWWKRKGDGLVRIK